MSLIEGQSHHAISESEGRCACGWTSKASTEGRRRAALKAHIRAKLSASEAGLASADALADIQMWEHKGFIAHAQRGLGVFLQWFLRERTIGVVSVFVLFWFSVFLTTSVREQNTGWLFATISVVLSVIVFSLFGLLTLGWQNRLVAGPPIFGKYGGIGSRVYSYALLGAQEVTLKFSERDKKSAHDLSDADAELTEDMMRWTFETDGGLRAREPLPDEKWRNTWSQVLLAAPVDGLTFKDAMAEDNLSFNVVLARLIASQALMAPIFVLFNLGVVALAVGFLQGRFPLLVLVQVGAILAVILAIIIVLYHRFVPNELGLPVPDVPSEDLAEELNTKYSERLKITVKPSSIHVTPRYRLLVRRFHSVIALLGGLNTAIALAVVSIFIVSLGSLWAFELSSEVLSWYGRLLVVLALSFIGFAVVLLFMFMAIERGRVIVSAVLSALGLALLPSLINYAVTGALEINQLLAAASAAFGGAATVVANAVLARKPGPVMSTD